MPLTITYDGEPFGLDLLKLDALDQTALDQLSVPSWDDEFPGRSCSRMFYEALEASVITKPPGMNAECHGDDDDGGSGFVLVAYNDPDDEPRKLVGVTGGWRDADNVWLGEDDKRACDDRSAIVDALQFFVGQLNMTLELIKEGRA